MKDTSTKAYRYIVGNAYHLEQNKTGQGGGRRKQKENKNSKLPPPPPSPLLPKQEVVKKVVQKASAKLLRPLPLPALASALVHTSSPLRVSSTAVTEEAEAGAWLLVVVVGASAEAAAAAAVSRSKYSRARLVGKRRSGGVGKGLVEGVCRRRLAIARAEVLREAKPESG